MKRGIASVTDVLSAIAMVVWVGGHAALGAFAARIAFQDLPRPEAAQMMTRVFREFDRVIFAMAILLAIFSIAGLVARRASVISQVRFGLELGLVALGAFELAYVHAHIEQLFLAGQTLAPAFASLHELSERCAHGEALLVVLAFVARAWENRYL